MLLQFFLGEGELSFKKEYKKEVLRILADKDIPFRFANGEDSFSFFVPLYRRRSLCALLEEVGIPFEKKSITGLPRIIHSYRKRIGIPIGALIIGIMIWLSGRVIWCVNVEGNTTVSDGEIIELLEKLGCGVGDTYRDIDFDVLHNRFLMESENIAWIAVNMNGTHANVEVRETVNAQEKEDDDGFYNLIASEDGTVERIAATEGKPVVEIGDTVRKGELLVSGAITYKEIYNRYESAAGSVYASVLRSFSVSVPYEAEKKTYTGEKTVKRSLRIFKFNINLFTNSSNPYRFCDTITVYKQVYLFDTVALPVYVKTTEYREYGIEKEHLSEKEASERAMALYREELRRVVGDASLLKKTVTKEASESEYIIRCEMRLLADIAKKAPLIISKEENQNNKETEKYDQNS